MTTVSLDLKSLEEVGALASNDLVEETVEWTQDGQEYKGSVWIRRLSYATATSEIMANRQNADFIAARIASSCCDVEGKPLYTTAAIMGTDGRGLHHNLILALLAAIGRANDLGKPQARRSPKTRKSSTNSSSTASAVEPSPRQLNG